MALETGSLHPRTAALSAALSVAASLVLLTPGESAGGDAVSATSLEEVAAAWLASDEAQALTAQGAAQARAARVRRTLLSDAGLELRREQGELGGEAYSTSFLGASAELDWTGRALAANRAGELGAETSALQTRASLLEGACDVAGLALAAEARRQRAAAMETAQARLDELVRILDGLATTGGTSAYELGRARGAARQHRLALRSAQAGAADAHAALRALAGHDGLDGLPEPGALPSLEHIGAQTWEHAPSLRAARLEAESLRQAAQAEGRAWAPSLELYGGVRQDQQGALEPGQGLEVGARIGLPGLDGGHRQAREATANRHRAAAQLQRTEARLLARLAGLHGRGLVLRQEQELGAEPADPWPAAWERYLAGEAELTELLGVTDQSEAEALAGVDWRSQVVTLDLELACAAGTFAQHTLDLTLESAP